MNALDLAEPVNTPRGDPEPLADQSIRYPFTAEPPDLLPKFCRSLRSSDLCTAGTGGDQSSLRSLADEASLKLRHRHQYAELQPADGVVVGSVNALADANERDAEPGQFLDDNRQVNQGAADAVGADPNTSGLDS